ncbi:centrosomal protein 15 kDa [Osmerus eperlanus]|uniref:centrosomal protein 15 kDa n=1 Tax=Osmerus eperlanus TaxID=29151 RepID=UPI002E10A8B5
MDCLPEEVELSKKHEEILGKRAVLLREMERRYEEHKCKRRLELQQSPTAHARNAKLLADMQTLEDRLRTRQLPHPDVLTLETRYWASVEGNIPEWERFLLGKGPHPVDETGKPPRRQKHKVPLRDHVPTQQRALPPHPKARAAKRP